MKRKKWLFTISYIISLVSFQASAQDYPHEIDEYPFIKYELNKLTFYGDSSGFEKLFNKFDKVVYDGTEQVDIIHMGGSHIQAGVFSAQMRKHLQTIQPGLHSYRGLIFPFRMARTNNPSNYGVHFTGSWESCRNVEKKRSCTLGLTGISATTYTPSTRITVSFDQDYIPYDYQSVKVFHDTDTSSFTVVPGDSSLQVVPYPELGYTLVTTSIPQDSLTLHFVKTSPSQNHFTLYGLKFETKDPGFAYHAIGINGASVPSYLRCNLLPLHTQAVEPELIIFSIGINDAYTTKFSPSIFKQNYRDLIKMIKSVSPDVSIIFTTNNDSYYKRRYTNKNGEKVKEAMIELAKEHNAAVWDLYTIMGGYNSIATWESYGLAKYDKIHFTSRGYVLAGDLFFSALVKAYEQHITKSY
ncbi:MAG: GDSL-type esterase/lipase family protein [Cyclobacteriaceae bacterium]|nr:GDSL-type esterase/lipase family protein [Cyclobacteriaceae bacterium]